MTIRPAVVATLVAAGFFWASPPASAQTIYIGYSNPYVGVSYYHPPLYSYGLPAYPYPPVVARYGPAYPPLPPLPPLPPPPPPVIGTYAPYPVWRPAYSVSPYHPLYGHHYAPPYPVLYHR